jgi:hypothetical protein
VIRTVENHNGDVKQIRQCSEPSKQVKEIFDKPKYLFILLPHKKSAWHIGETLKNGKQL